MTVKHPAPPASPRELLLFAGYYFLLACFTAYTSSRLNGFATFWLGNAVTVAYLLNRAKTSWPVILLISCGAVTAAGWVNDVPWLHVSVILLVNLCEIALAVLLISRFAADRGFEYSPVRLIRLIAIAAGLPPVVAAVMGAFLISEISSRQFSQMVPAMFSGASIAMIAGLLPITLVLRQGVRQFASRLQPRRSLPLALALVVITPLSLMNLPSPVVYIALPLMLTGAFLRFEAVSLLVLMVVLLIGALARSYGVSVMSTLDGWQLLLRYLPVLAALPAPLILAASVNQTRQRERMLAKTELRFRDALQFAAVGLALADPAGHLSPVNKSLCKILGLGEATLLGADFLALVHPDDRQQLLTSLDTVAQGDDVQPAEIRFLRQDGVLVWTRLLLARLRSEGEDGMTELIIQLDDITASRSIQQEMLALSERLSMATRAGNMGVWEIPAANKAIVWDEQMFALYDLPTDTLVTPELWSARIYPEDLPAIQTALREAVIGKGTLIGEFRVFRQDGSLRTLKSVCIVKSRADGRATDMVGMSWDVSHEKAVEQSLARHSQELQTIIDHMPAMVGYWDRELHNRFGNLAYREWFGIEAEKLRGMHMADVIGAERFVLNRPYIDAALAGQAQMFERTIVLPDGERRESLATYVPDMEGEQVKGFYAFVTDITPIRQAENERLNAQRLLRSVIDAAVEFSIIATDLDGTIRLFSAGAEHMTGYRAEEMVGLATPELIHDPLEVLQQQQDLIKERGAPVAPFEVFVDAARHGKVETHEWTYIRKDGSRLPVNLVVSPTHDEHGRINGFLGIARDITERKHVEDELRNATAQAQSASRAKSEFVANMSHELRTPMNAVLGMSHLLSKTRLSADQKKYLDMIRVSGQALLAILNDILDFSKIEAGRMELSTAPFDLEDVIDGVAGIMSISAGDKELELCISIAPGVPRALVGDAMRLQQILINLAGNAIKFTERGEVVLGIDFVNHDGSSPALAMSMRDSGIGMTPDQQARLFAPFTQGDASVTRRFGGTGLGLAITGRLVRLMGGHIEVISSLGAGSRFDLLLPVALAPDQSAMLDAPLGGMRLLVMDGNRASQTGMTNAITSLGALTACAASLAEGLPMLANDGRAKAFDAMVLDWQMLLDCAPDVLEEIRSSAVPLLVTASTAGREMLVHAGAAFDAERILLKPVTRSSLKEAMEFISQAHQDSRGKVVASTPPNEKQRFAGAQILLVEDNEMNQIVARVVLEQAGAVVTLAQDGAQAVYALRHQLIPFDLVLMDVQMQVMDGYTATRMIRNELGLTLPIIAMTAGVMDSEREECLASGMDDFIAKPIDVQRLHTVLDFYLGGARATPEKIAPPPPPVRKGALFDPSALLKLGAGDAAYRRTVLGLINELLDGKLDAIDQSRDLWRSGLKKEGAQILHTLRGSIGSIGAQQLAGALLELEPILAKGSSDQVDRMFESVLELRDQTIAAARAWLARQPVLS
jgi:PAS domain S-box-containing protein